MGVMKHDTQNNDQNGQATGQNPDHTSVIDLGAARTKFAERKKQREEDNLASAARFREEARRKTAGGERGYRVARGIQIAVIAFAIVYLLNTCGFLPV